MIISVNKQELIGFFCLMDIYHPGMANFALLVNDYVTFSSLIHIEKKLPIGLVELSLDALPRSDGSIELIIKTATVLGSSLFGVVRKKAGDFIISSINSYPPMQASKMANGNIKMWIPGILITDIKINGDLQVEAHHLMP